MVDSTNRVEVGLGPGQERVGAPPRGEGVSVARFTKERAGAPQPGGFTSVFAAAQRRSIHPAARGAGAATGVEPRPEETREGLQQAARAVEAFFITELYAAMKRSVPEGGLFTRSLARDIYEGMFAENLAQAMAEAGGIGLAQLLVDQMGSYVDQGA